MIEEIQRLRKANGKIARKAEGIKNKIVVNNDNQCQKQNACQICDYRAFVEGGYHTADGAHAAAD